MCTIIKSCVSTNEILKYVQNIYFYFSIVNWLPLDFWFKIFAIYLDMLVERENSYTVVVIPMKVNIEMIYGSF